MESHTIPFNVEEGQKLQEGPQLLRSHGAQEQVEGDYINQKNQVNKA